MFFVGIVRLQYAKASGVKHDAMIIRAEYADYMADRHGGRIRAFNGIVYVPKW